MNSALWSNGQLTIQNLSGWDGTYWVNGQPLPNVNSINTVNAGTVLINAAATTSFTGTRLQQSSTSLITTATFTRAVGTRIPANELIISTQATIFARGSYSARGRALNTVASATTLLRGRALKSGVLTRSGTASLSATARTTVQTTALLSGSATFDGTPRYLTSGAFAATLRGLLTGTRGSRITRAATNVLLGRATFFATTPAATGVAISHQTSALLRKTQTATHSSDALLRASFTRTHSTDSLLRKTQSSVQSTNALLLAGFTRTHSTDALLAAERQIVHTNDALLMKEQALAHTTDASLLPESAEHHHTSARLYGRVALTHGTNARLLTEFTGSGVLSLPSLQLTGAGLVNHYYPKKAVATLPKLEMRGRGQFVAPEARPQVSTDVYYRNRRYLEAAYGWGRVDLFEPFDFNPCGCEPVQDYEVLAQRLDPAFLEWDRQRALRAAFLAQERLRARQADPSYQEPVWNLPEAKESPPELVQTGPRVPYSIEPRRGPLPSLSGGVRLLPAVELPKVVEEVQPPQPVVILEAEPEVLVPEVEHPRQNFHVDLPRPKIERGAGEIAILAEAPSPHRPSEAEDFTPPQPIVHGQSEMVDTPVALLDPPSRSRGFSVGPRNRKRRH